MADFAENRRFLFHIPPAIEQKPKVKIASENFLFFQFPRYGHPLVAVII